VAQRGGHGGLRGGLQAAGLRRAQGQVQLQQGEFKSR